MDIFYGGELGFACCSDYKRACSCYSYAMKAAATVLPFATEEDFFALGEGVKAELISGEILMAPSALGRHGQLQGNMFAIFGDAYSRRHGRGGPGGWQIILEVDVRLKPGLILRPDIAGWRRERMPKVPDSVPIDLAPDWICEVVSPSNARHDRIRKRKIYLEQGVQHYWIIDPQTDTLEALELSNGRWLELGVFGRGDAIAIEPFVATEWLLEDVLPE